MQRRRRLRSLMEYRMMHSEILAAVAAVAVLAGGGEALAERVLIAAPISYPAPGKEPQARMEFPAGATPISGPEIVAALSDHTAMLPGGFVEYYAPDGT